MCHLKHGLITKTLHMSMDREKRGQCQMTYDRLERTHRNVTMGQI